MAASGAYGGQDRGNAAAYDAYYAAMDSTMRQKLAFVGAHFLLDPGSRIADMGCGSGYGTYQLALLNPHVKVIGVDINPQSVRIASEKYRLANLEFIVGDASEAIFAEDPVDGILSSSTLHHVYTFSGYSRDAVRRALASHMKCLRDGGVFVLRDFVIPARNEHVLLELALEPSRGDTPVELSDADLLVRFSRTARPLDKRCGPGFFLEELDPRRPGTRLFRLTHKWAAEFVLRKDYRDHWDVELLEEYTYFTADEFASELAVPGGRLICAEPYWNPWIVKNRFERKVRLYDEAGKQLDWPPTNFVAVTERVPAGASLRLVERRIAPTLPSFLALETWKSADETFDLVRRPQPVCDLLPWRMSEGRLRVLAHHGYPRPITCAVPRGPVMIDGSRWGGYLIEPVTGMVASDASLKEIAAAMTERVGIESAKVTKIEEALTYYPSPGGIDEVVHSFFVELAAPLHATPLSTAISGLSTAGQVREFDAQDLLRAAHVGVLPEARLEANLYALMDRLGTTPDPFIGGEIESVGAAERPEALKTLESLLGNLPTAPFTRSDVTAGYLRLIRSTFADQTDEEGLPRTLAELDLEFVVPREQSTNTAVALPLLFSQAGVMVGLEIRSLPVPQIHEGNATILTAPAWRLERYITTLAGAKEFLASQLGSHRITPLGAAYFASAGITPERVHPFVVAIERGAADLPYAFVPLEDLKARIFSLRDGHLLIAACRLIHALGRW
jgi:SAM-dependent methyltransferase